MQQRMNGHLSNMRSRFMGFARMTLLLPLMLLLISGSHAVLASSSIQSAEAIETESPTPQGSMPTGKWVQVPSPTDRTLYSCDFAATDDGWAVGMGIFHWDGKEWSQVVEKEWPPYYSVEMLSETDGWVVGREGAILHWDGKTWAKVASPTEYDLFDISFTDPDQGWIVGGDPDYMALPGKYHPDRILLTWDGKEWKEAPFPKGELVNSYLTDIQMISPTDGWVLGVGQFHWDGKQWKKLTIESSDAVNVNDFLSVSALSANEVWMAGYQFPKTMDNLPPNKGVIYHWDGSVWNEVFRSDQGPFLSIHMLAPDFGWAGGGDDVYNGTSRIAHWDGKTWREDPPLTKQPIRDICAVSKTDAWLVTGGFTGSGGEIYRYVTEVEPTALPTQTLPPRSTPTKLATATLQVPTATATATVLPPNTQQPSNGLFLIGLLTIFALVLLLWSLRRKR